MSREEINKVATLLRKTAGKRPSPQQIVQAVCDAFGLRLSEFTKPGRPAAIAIPRMLSMSLCHELTDLNQVENATLHGRGDRTTVIHARKRMARETEDVIARLQFHGPTTTFV